MGGGEASHNPVLAPQTRYTEDMELLHDTMHTATSTRNDRHCSSGDLSCNQMARYATSGRRPRIVPSNYQKREAMRFFVKGEQELMDAYRKGVENRVLSSPALALRQDLVISHSQQKKASDPSANRSGRRPRIVASNYQKREAMRFFFKGEQELMDACRNGVENRVLSSPALALRQDLVISRSQQKKASDPSATRSGRTPRIVASNYQKREAMRFFFKREQELIDEWVLSSRALALRQDLIFKRSRELVSREGAVNRKGLCPPPPGLVREFLLPVLKKRRSVPDCSPFMSGFSSSDNMDAEIHAFKNLQI